MTNQSKGKGNGICLESRYPCDYTLLQTLLPLAVGTQQPATTDPTLDLCTRYPLWLGGPGQCGIQSLPDTFKHGQPWELNPRPDLESNTLSTWPHAPKV